MPDMRKLSRVEADIGTSDAGLLPEALHAKLQANRWEREPTEWSQ